MKLYRIEEQCTSGWAEVISGLTKDEANNKLNALIQEGYNPNDLRVRVLLNE